MSINRCRYNKEHPRLCAKEQCVCVRRRIHCMEFGALTVVFGILDNSVEEPSSFGTMHRAIQGEAEG